MLPLFERLQKEMDEVVHQKSIVLPTYPVGEGETVLGKISPELEALWSVVVDAMRISGHAVVDSDTSFDEDRRRVLDRRAEMFKEKYKIAVRVFWASVRDEFDVWDKNLGLRENGKIVALPEKNEAPEESNGLPAWRVRIIEWAGRFR